MGILNNLILCVTNIYTLVLTALGAIQNESDYQANIKIIFFFMAKFSSIIDNEVM